MLTTEQQDKIKDIVDKSVIMRVYGWPLGERRWRIIVGDETLSIFKEFDNEDEARAYASVVKAVITCILEEAISVT